MAAQAAAVSHPVDYSPTASPRWWQWPTIVSLDAPLVVTAWQQLLGAIVGVPVRWPEAFVLGTSIWLAYVADRWIEGWRLVPSLIRTQRHRFYQRHRWAVAVVWLVVLLADGLVAFVALTGRELGAGASLLAPTLLYVLSHQLIHRERRGRVPKEFCVAVLLAGGAAVFVGATPGVEIQSLLIPTGLFAALCFVNVALIAVWEREVDETHGQESIARNFRRAPAVSRILPFGLATVSAVLGAYQTGGASIVAHCVAASAILLAVVDRLENRIGWQVSRVLADVVLLTPLLPLVRRYFE